MSPVDPKLIDLPAMREASRLLHSWANAITAGNRGDEKAIAEARLMRATAKRVKASYNRIRAAQQAREGTET